jgi:microcystin-dependent protein
MDPILGQIIILPFNWAPSGWLPCNGALLQINQNQALFSLLGTQFGGDGRTTFGLPKLAAPVAGSGYYIAVSGVYPSRP